MSGHSSPSPPPAKRRRMSPSPPASSSASSIPVPETSGSVPSTTTNAGPDPMISASTMPEDEITDDIPTDALLGHPQNEVSRATWPLDAVPVEIFNLIIRYLNRKDVQAMRLVSREFDSKLADSFFRNVVVPFRPEFEALYGTLDVDLGFSPEQQKYGLVLKKRTDESSAIEAGNDSKARDNPTAMGDESLLSDGYRVFEQFGPTHIHKFALALELDELDLACPPVKLNQEIVPAPWGLYRWPIAEYQRYAQLEGIEKLADETGHMKRAFQSLRVVSEIGLSCDAGLGYLQGPDTNALCRRLQPPVFRPPIYDGAEANPEDQLDEDSDRSMGLIILKHMAMNAGYDSNEWPRAVLRLLEDEGRAVRWVEHVSASGAPSHKKTPLFETTKDTTKEKLIDIIERLLGEDPQSDKATGAAHAQACGLVPNSLTASQVEMLLELEWAHRALMDSYVIAVMDNKDSFQALNTLTIARCSGQHVPSLMKEDFWEAMTCLKSFNLGVIPDWRRLHKDDTGGVSQRRISPIDSYGAVFSLLHNFVGEQENIKHVSFQWISGGEFAIGKSQRDRYIMPAPVLSNAANMTDLQHEFGENDVISLPYVDKLSLKNCWFTPHVFLNVVKRLSRETLRDLELESVSLTGPPSKANEASVHPGAQGKPLHWPWPLCAGAEPGSWFQLRRTADNNQNNQINNAPAPNVAFPAPPPGAGLPAAGAFTAHQTIHFNNHAWIAQHSSGAVAINETSAPAQQSTQTSGISLWRCFSWPHILASLNMSPEAVHSHLKGVDPEDKHYHKMKTHEQYFSRIFNHVHENRGETDRLKTITLKSCGYALIDAPHISNWRIIPSEPLLVQHDPDLLGQLKELDSQMLICNDGLLGKTLNYIPEAEQRILSRIFGLGFGWDDLYDEIVTQIAVVDGNPSPGLGRFHGNVSSSAEMEAISLKSKGKQIAVSHST
ncbi:hypothetical protein KVR01_010155 [Diaporthe batatas]|uniref:uncharacterized protein n=1 Tax=Diaporthe batatas TaxID=748121 RepID=UPI001D0446F3|nr:uncharacterized protein KVR01_010155 [Diaporthe batatas]KAG8159518.1 hypothetical protein KVR01_010155 [Diaporthe batatas]